MVKHILDQIMSPNTELKTEVNICKSSHSSTFFKASTYLSSVLVRIYPSANPSLGRFRKRSIYATVRGDRGIRRCGRFNGSVCGRGCGGKYGKFRGGHVQGCHGGVSGAYENGIDISDVTRHFEDSEWATILNDTRKSITEDRVRTKFLTNKKRRTTRSVSVEKNNKNQLISQIITGVKNASQNESGLEGGVTRVPTNGRMAQLYAYNRGSTSSNRNETEEQSLVVYDRLCNLVTNN